MSKQRDRQTDRQIDRQIDKKLNNKVKKDRGNKDREEKTDRQKY